MAGNSRGNTFYNHFSQDKPTKLGQWMVTTFSQKIFEIAKIKREELVLEIGPGRGGFADVCAANGAEYWAIEPNQKMAEDLERRGMKVIQAVVPPIPKMERSFDAVVMINVMEHMDGLASALQITEKIKDVLNQNGKIIICSPDYLNLRHNFFNCDFSHNYVTTRRRLEQLLISAGFVNIKSFYLSGSVAGLLCFLISAFVARLPFGSFNAWFPSVKVFQKLYKFQLAFSRKVLVVAEKQN